MKTILTASRLKKVYGSKKSNHYTALQDISFSIREGEFVGIMGPSGSGKTTLLNILSTLDQATSGTISIDGIVLSAMNEDQLSEFRSKRLGFIFQDFNLLENMTVFENISLPLSLHGHPPGVIKERVTKLAATLSIEGVLDKFPSEISGGQKQRTAIARALIHRPALVLGDEPTGALDSKNATTLLETLSTLNEEEQVSIAMVTHDAKSASYCSRLFFIQDGNIIRELKRTQTRERFYDEIVDVVSELGR
ncbi:ABC transporter ATP-binding protein [Sporosarcina sp. NCCP-2222]|uniref:ABC transporter ATP-binding protein n=1 Tax=Sporosarcina sp. NCCP-2222 TaxID=2935073 RepID=UPI0020898619|nr:ABC transporter ATP-binding protein [Sporosarcina sp. NCCP-2222]GKV56592.1 ABC transporter ATP-binding protein [Sporosarcina sp. NCCP-2222]